MLLSLYSSLLMSMEDTRITIPSSPEDEATNLSNKAVEVYFRGNAKTLHDTLIPYIKFKIEEANSPIKPDPLIGELKNLTLYGERSVHLGDRIHKLVSDSLEEALKEKELSIEKLKSQRSSDHKQRNAAIGAALISLIGAITAALTHLTTTTS